VSKIEKDASNPHFRNRYASLDTIVDEIRPILTKHGLSILQMPSGDGESFSLTTMLLHESGEWIESPSLMMRPVKNDPQGIGSCTTYARRYSLCSFLSLNTGEDDDGNAATAPNKPRQQPQPTNTPPKPQNAPTGQSGAQTAKGASEQQIKMINALVSQLSEKAGYSREQIKDTLAAKQDVGKFNSFSEITSNQASKIIGYLQKAVGGNQ
jgi:hypothetical protein